MPVLTWTCAHGDSPSVTIPCAATTAISPGDDSVDSNSVIVNGTGTISSFGPCSYPITKNVTFEAGVTLVNSPNLVLLTGQNRTVTAQSYGDYATKGDGIWTELDFSTVGASTSTEGRIGALENEVQTLESQVATLQSEVTTNTNQIAALQNQVNALQANHAAWINHLEANVNAIYVYLDGASGGMPSTPPSTPP